MYRSHFSPLKTINTVYTVFDFRSTYEIIVMVNNTSQNYTEEEIKEYLSVLQHRSTVVFVPALIYLSLLIVVGSIGNCLVLVVYWSKMSRTPLRIFIISMAVFDLPTNTLLVPGEMYDLLHMWDFNSQILCQTRRCFTATFVVSSFVVLVAIAATKYKMVCNPFGKQVSILEAKVASVFILCIAALVSIPFGMIHGTQKKNTPNPNMFGRFCDIDDSYITTVWPNIISGFYVVLFLVCCLTMIVLYAHIGYQTWVHRNRRRQLSRLGQASVSEDFISVTLTPVPERKCCSEEMDEKLRSDENLFSQRFNIEFSDTKSLDNKVRNYLNVETSVSLREDQIRCDPGKCEDSKVKTKKTINVSRPTSDLDFKRKNSMQNTSPPRASLKRTCFLGRTSRMLITVSLVFVLGSFPFLALNFYKTSSPKSFAALEGLPLGAYHLFVRSYFLNSALNPIVYSLLDKKFRKECRNIFHLR
ncbi:uncharacterized protein LOC106080142 isoform X1 [Biomphalaria glabrata]|uniref:Uncharacterized protein LOC106080142 isoform X1 n=2 Tax=Biomphalaria glabrata TaxID=6526 RepID=A0A9U8EPM7_BIOGL|nr:uncharacterized protein LOC106080142 isoform X1 [Biomphalaria glabrata]